MFIELTMIETDNDYVDREIRQLFKKNTIKNILPIDDKTKRDHPLFGCFLYRGKESDHCYVKESYEEVRDMLVHKKHAVDADDSIERNKMQLKFMSREYSFNFCKILFYDQISKEFSREKINSVLINRCNSFTRIFGNNPNPITIKDYYSERLGSDGCCDAIIKYGMGSAVFEPIDVSYNFEAIFKTTLFGRDIDYGFHRAIRIELRPIIGDDYPSVLRKIRKFKNKRGVEYCNCLIYRDYNGSKKIETIIDFFKSQNVAMIKEADLQVFSTKEFPRKIALIEDLLS